MLTNTASLVYHYTTKATAIEYILETMTLRLGPLEDTNDPAEADYMGFSGRGGDPDVDFLHLLAEAREVFHAGHKLACFTQDVPGTEEAHNWPLAHGQAIALRGYARDRMWAQYAENHSGVCLFFDQRSAHRCLPRPPLSESLPPMHHGSLRAREHPGPSDCVPARPDHCSFRTDCCTNVTQGLFRGSVSPVGSAPRTARAPKRSAGVRADGPAWLSALREAGSPGIPLVPAILHKTQTIQIDTLRSGLQAELPPNWYQHCSACQVAPVEVYAGFPRLDGVGAAMRTWHLIGLSTIKLP